MKQILGILLVLLSVAPTIVLAKKTDLYNLSGEAVVYIDTDKELAIYTWDGEAVSYLVNGCGKECFYIYTWEGGYIGFLENGIVYDLQGKIVGSMRRALNITYYAPHAKYAQYVQSIRKVCEICSLCKACLFKRFFQVEPKGICQTR